MHTRHGLRRADPTHVNISKSFTEISETHPEAAVVAVLVVDQLLHARSPVARAITPAAFPLEIAPGVSNAQQAMSISLLGIENAVWVWWCI
jgi:anaerobic C4-dicarboxylate transporter